jgi:FkbM family methyltransferase
MSLRAFLRPIVERKPALAIVYRAIRDEMQRQKQISVMTPFGFRIAGNQSMQMGTFEIEETRLLKHYIADTDVFLDVGANIGFYSCFARNMGKHVIAIEPLNQNLQMLYRNLEDNGWQDVEVWPVGLADSSGITTIYGGGTGASLIEGWAGCSSVYKQTISVFTLDLIVKSRFIDKRMVIKVDVEGTEYSVLKGAQNMLQRLPKPVWLVEISLSAHHPGGANSHFAQTFTMFWDNGYEARTGNSQQRLVLESDVKRWVKSGNCDFSALNWLFIPVR